MPWLLDTAFSPGDLDAGKSYTHQKIAHLEHSIREKFIRLHIERGYIDGSDWVWATQGEALVVLIKDDPAAEPAVTDYTDLVATVVGASIGSPASPGVGIVILATILGGLGVPSSGVALIIGVDRILDMCRTANNIVSDSSITMIVAHTEGEVDDSVLFSP